VYGENEMVVGILRLEIWLFSSNSLKDKRRLIKSLIARLRNNFNASVSEIGYQDSRQRALMGIAIVTNESRFAYHSLSKIVEFVKNRKELSLVDSEIEVI